MDAPGDVGAIGLTEKQVRAVVLVLSATLNRWRGKRKWTYKLCQQLAVFGGLREGPWPSSGRAFREAGLTPEELDLRWDLATTGDRMLPTAILAAFFPLELWPTLWELIEQGPRATGRRAETLYRHWAKGRTLEGEPRRTGRLSSETIELHITALWGLMDEICDLQKDKAHPAFRAWRESEKPRRLRPKKLGAIPNRRDRRAPEQLAARKAIRALDERVRARKKTVKGQASLFCPLRDRAVVALFLLLGGRVDEIATLKVSSFCESWPFADGPGPAILIIPNKTDPGVVRAKAIPKIVAAWLREYLAYVGHAEKPDFPLWLPNCRASVEAGKLIEPQQIQQTVTDAFRPFCDRRISPTSLRHLASKLAWDFGNTWISEHNREIAFDDRLPAAAQTFSDVLLDHALRDPIDKYKDISSDPGREKWGRLAALGVWELVWTDAGARKAPNAERITAAERSLGAHEATAESLHGRIASLRQQKSALRASADESETTNDLLRLQFRIGGIDDEIALALERLLETVTATGEAKAELDLAHEDRIPVSDSLSDEELAALDDAAARSADAQPETRPILRYECTPVEFRWAFGGELLSQASVNRYMNGVLPHPPGDPRNVFEPNPEGGRPACVISVSERDNRIRLDLLDWKRFPVEIQERFDELMRTPWPRRNKRLTVVPAADGADSSAAAEDSKQPLAA